MNESDKTFSIKARNMSALAALSVVVIHAGNGGMGSFTLTHPAWWAYAMRAGIVALLSIWVAQLLHKFLPRGSRVLFGGR